MVWRPCRLLTCCLAALLLAVVPGRSASPAEPLPVRLVLDSAALALADGKTEEARRLLAPLALAGDGEAMFHLGRLVEEGKGAPPGTGPDPVAAYVWFVLAAERGNSSGRDARNALAARLPVDRLVAAFEAAAVFVPQALTAEDLRQLLAARTSSPASMPALTPAPSATASAAALPPLLPAPSESAPRQSAAPEDVEPLAGRFVVVEGANLRAAPTTQAARIGGLGRGQGVVAKGRNGSWILVSVPTGGDAWILENLLAPDGSAAAAAARAPAPAATAAPAPPPQVAPAPVRASSVPAQAPPDLLAQLAAVGSRPADPALLKALTGRWSRDCSYPGGEMWRPVGPAEMEWQVATPQGPLVRTYSVAGSPDQAVLLLRQGDVSIARRLRINGDTLVIDEILAIESGRLTSREVANYTFHRCPG